MGIMDFIKGQLIDVIDCYDDSQNTLMWRFPMNGKDIMMNAQLVVRQSQQAIFVNEGKIADVFDAGTFTLTTQNMPLLTKLKSWKYGFESPFKTDVYYVNLKRFLDQKWGTPSPIIIIDPEFGGRLPVQMRGQYGFRVMDSVRFLEEYVGTNDVMTTDKLVGYLRSHITQNLIDTIQTSKMGYTAISSNLMEFSDKVSTAIQEKFSPLGLELIDFAISDITLPEDLMAELKRGTGINLMGGLQTAATIGTIEAMKTAAANPGNPMASMGVGVGMMGVVGQMMGQMGNQMPQGQAAQATPTTPCPKCNMQVAGGTKFCPHCGSSMAPPMAKCIKCAADIAVGAKFCANCGASQQAAACAKCGAAQVPGAKFCPECGSANQT